MTKYMRTGFRKLPTLLGGGILGVAMVGLLSISFGVTLPLFGEIISAAAGMAVVGKYA